MFPKVERCLGLHQNLKVIYVVDGYNATLSNDDGYPTAEFKGHGESIELALIDLNNNIPDDLLNASDMKKGYQ